MPGPITDPALLAQLNAGQPAPAGIAPQPLPGQPRLINPRLESLKDADVRLGYAGDENARGWAELENQRERLRIAQQEADRKNKTAAANQGVETTASQEQAVGHEIMLRNSLATLDEIGKSLPKEIQPTWKEFGVTYLTKNDPTLVGTVQTETRQRAYNAYTGAIDSAIWLATGAAAPEDQVKRIASTLTPLASDKPGVLQDKRRGLLAYIEQAKARAGPANLKVQEALDALTAKTGMIYGEPQEVDRPEQVHSGNTLDLGDPTKKLSGDTAAVPYPPEGEAAHTAFMQQHKPGTLTVGEYLDFRKALDQKMFGDKYDVAGVDFKAAQDFVDKFNKTGEFGHIAPTERKLGMLEKPFAKAAANEGLLGDTYALAANVANAGAAGIPSLLAGQENRDAFDMLNQAHPKSAMTGEVVGSIAPILTLEQAASRGLAKLGAEEGGNIARAGADVLANTGYGAAKGFNEADTGEGLEGATEGGLEGMGGSVLGRGVAKGVKEFTSKETRQALDALDRQPIFDDAGKQVGWTKPVNLTAMQRMGLGKGEEFIEPFFGVAKARQGAVDSFNLHQAADAAAAIGEKLPAHTKPGQHAATVVDGLIDNAYRAIEGKIRGTVDKTWLTVDLPAIRSTALAPRHGRPPSKGLQKVWQELESATKDLNVGGKFDFASYKDFASKVREIQVALGGKPTGITKSLTPAERRLLQGQAKELLGKAREMISRVDPVAGARLKRIDTAYSKLMRMRIVGEGPALKLEGVGAPEEWIAGIKKSATNKKALTEGKSPGQLEANAAMRVIGKKPARGASILGSFGLGFGSGGVIIPAAGVMYTPPARQLLQALTDGRIAARADGLMPKKFVAKHPWAKELPSDVAKQIMASYLRERANRTKKEYE